MKKKALIFLVFVLVLTVVFAGCKKKDEPVEEPNTPLVQQPVEEAEENEKKAIMDGFNELISKDPHVFDIKEYIHENIAKLGPLEVSTMVDNLEAALKKGLDGLRTEIVSTDEDNELIELVGQDLFLKEDMIDDIRNAELKELITKAYNSHYKLMSTEGMIEPVIDYRSLLQYEDKLTDEWKEYIELMAEDSDSPPYLDGSLLISFDELGQRIINLESYMNRYISGPRHEELVDIYEERLTAFMKGLPNSPLAAYDNNIIFENIYKAYESFGANEGLVSTGFVYDYMTAIRDNGMKVDSSILKLADEYIEEAVMIMKEFK
ncbi:MAG TPA: hypothetical protein DIT39_03075 [Tissierellales bacterium]|nr:hypothetical protein [Tissierellales bacterium]